MNETGHRGRLVVRISGQSVEKHLSRHKRRAYAAAATPLILLFIAFAFLYVRTLNDPAGRGALATQILWVAVFLTPTMLLIAYLEPRHLKRFFNDFGVYTLGISPPFRHVTSIPYPSLVRGLSLSRFLKVLYVRARREPYFIPLSRMTTFQKTRGWEDSFVFDIVTEDEVRTRIMAPNLEEFYFPGDRERLHGVYRILEQVRRQVEKGTNAISIDTELIRAVTDEGPQGG